jgi:hypothetical protein
MQHLLDAVTATGPSDPYNVQSHYRNLPRAVKVNIPSGTATVKLEGQMGGGDGEWVQLGGDFTATAIQFLQLPPVVRFNVAAISGATVDAWIDALG